MSRHSPLGILLADPLVDLLPVLPVLQMHLIISQSLLGPGGIELFGETPSALRSREQAERARTFPGQSVHLMRHSGCAGFGPLRSTASNLSSGYLSFSSFIAPFNQAGGSYITRSDDALIILSRPTHSCGTVRTTTRSSRVRRDGRQHGMRVLRRILDPLRRFALARCHRRRRRSGVDTVRLPLVRQRRLRDARRRRHR